MCDNITYSFPNFNDAAFEAWEGENNFISHLIGHVVTYPCWDLSEPMVAYGVLEDLTVWQLQKSTSTSDGVPEEYSFQE